MGIENKHDKEFVMEGGVENENRKGRKEKFEKTLYRNSGDGIARDNVTI